MATLALSMAGQFVGGAVGGPIGATIGRALGALAGSAVDQVLFGETIPPAAGADIRLVGSSEGAAIPRLYGWSRLAGNIIWASELERLGAETSGAKGTSAADDEEICASFAIGLCEGEVARLGRIWADGQLLETGMLTLRFHRGSETQEVDSLIEAVQGTAPAYRGLCYLVFERLPLADFGNRIPNITVELCRLVGELEPLIGSMAIIPGATEFGYDPVPRIRLLGPGVSAAENTHLSALTSDWTLSIDELQALCPNLEHVALVVAWFGDDLRCGDCSIRPRVEAAGKQVSGTTWAVAGLTRATAEVVSTHAGGPAYGGTPSDAAVLAAIADLKGRGLGVTLYPMLLMDIAADNPLGQPAYPWRGRIACHPAPGTVGSPEGTAALDAQVAAFVGGPTDWRFRRFVRHYAALAQEAGADVLVLGSELRGLTTLRGTAGFPFVDALVTLAAEAKALAPGVKLTYAADWSEFHGFQPEETPGDKHFHLDPLWASAHIDAVGIDAYMPLADWREGEDHADAAAWDGPHELGYLGANLAGGEGFDWYYLSAADRLAGARTTIADPAHGEPWVWRFKDIAGWWSHAHHNRVGGVRSPTPTAWVPEGKPIWFTELGCAAVDKGANQPNLFPDPKSAEDGRPYFSNGAPDALLQRQVLRAHLRHWSGAGNPVSAVYAGPMVGRISLWSWDARPYPAFPGDAESWADAPNHAAGHWLTGRLGALASDELAAAIAADHDIEIVGTAAAPLVHGLALERPGSAREALDGLCAVTGLAVRDGAAGLELVRPVARQAVGFDEPVDDGGALISRRRPDPSERVARLALGYADRERDYLMASATAIRPEAGQLANQASGLVLDPAGGRQAAERLLAVAGAQRDALELTLPPSLARLEVGDVIALAGAADGPFEITEIRDGAARRIAARALPPLLNPAVLSGRPPALPGGGGIGLPVAEPLLVAAHLPPDPATPLVSRLLLAAFADPWPGQVELQLVATGERLTRLDRPAALGELASPLAAGPIERWDGAELVVTLFGGHLASVDGMAVLAGSNRIAVATDAGDWEVLGFAGAELIAPGTYRLTRLLRGQGGTDPAMGPAAAGNRVVVLDAGVALVDVPPGWAGETLALRAFAGRHDGVGWPLDVPVGLGPLLPLPPAHPRARRDSGGEVAFTWIRRSRADGGAWAVAEVGLEHLPEAYRLTVLAAGLPVRTLEAGAPAATYTAAEQAADFGSLPASFDFTVAQLSPVYGPGHPASGSFHA